VHPDVRPQAPERVAFILANGAHERPDPVVVVQMFLGGGRARTDRPAHRTLPAIGGLTMMVAALDGHLENEIDGDERLDVYRRSARDDHVRRDQIIRRPIVNARLNFVRNDEDRRNIGMGREGPDCGGNDGKSNGTFRGRFRLAECGRRFRGPREV